MAGKPGAGIQDTISVGLPWEGRDARTATYVMGMRALSSQVLCQPFVGRGLRRTSHEVNARTGFFEPEFANIFDVPFCEPAASM